MYWFDYQAGYDTVLAQLGWSNNPTQEIALVRGAANMQNKDWGTMITWKTNDYPSLPSGAEMYDNMRLSYESGAQYVVVFNYTPEYTGEWHYELKVEQGFCRMNIMMHLSGSGMMLCKTPK